MYSFGSFYCGMGASDGLLRHKFGVVTAHFEISRQNGKGGTPERPESSLVEVAKEIDPNVHMGITPSTAPNSGSRVRRVPIPRFVGRDCNGSVKHEKRSHLCHASVHACHTLQVCHVMHLCMA